MNGKENVNRIVNYLKIKPLNHGQVYAFQIAIPPSEKVNISFERHEYLKMSLTQQGTNLMPLIVRRTEAYSEEEEYELVYGADWCQVAKELDIEKLWVWVFDMTDEEASTTKEEMGYLLGSTQNLSDSLTTGKTDENGLQTLSSSLETELVTKVNDLSHQIKFVNNKCEQLINISKKQNETIDDLQSTISSLNQKILQLQSLDNQQENLDCDRIADLVFTKLENSIGKITPRRIKNQQEKEELMKLSDEEIIGLDKEKLMVFTKNELMEIAGKLDISFRKSWNKNEIVGAIRKARKKS